MKPGDVWNGQHEISNKLAAHHVELVANRQEVEIKLRAGYVLTGFIQRYSIKPEAIYLVRRGVHAGDEHIEISALVRLTVLASVRMTPSLANQQISQMERIINHHR